ncbi:hypothetical protein BDP27DRAFT_1292502 [Rhodocollybia butyracea]|uniref:DUF6533 domain-containing protein n=1 Tax=Rhodocollybia butyracea TaxID=206335 RepID=A0A9P5U900_9AGAR|nr:hypothetical protein BDP27DRAFT_1292502 [Rhodocollybia butyracea]
MTAISLTPEEVATYLDDRTLTSYALVSGAMLFLYDWMLMLPVELDVVWSKKLRPLDVLYIIQRYMPLVDTIGLIFVVYFVEPLEPNMCHILYNIGGWMYLTGMILTDVILMMRTWALWGKDIRLTIGLPIFFVGCCVPIFYITYLYLNSQISIPSPVPHVGCAILGTESMYFLVWVILMVLEAVILTLMLIPGLPYFRSGNWSALTTIIYRDGITYYLFIFGLSVANLLTVLLLPHDLETLFLTHQRVIQTLLTSRVVLHIRQQLHKSQAILLKEPERLGRQRVLPFR